MFESSKQLRISRTSDVWGIPMIESYSSKQCLRRPNDWKLFEQAMFEVSQWLKAIRTSNVWGIPTIESYSNKQCLRCPNDWKLFKRTMFEVSQRLKAIRTSNVWGVPTIESYSSERCLSSSLNSKPSLLSLHLLYPAFNKTTLHSSTHTLFISYPTDIFHQEGYDNLLRLHLFYQESRRIARYTSYRIKKLRHNDAIIYEQLIINNL